MDNTSYNLIFLVLAGLGTALACGLGVIPVWLLGDRAAEGRAALRGLAAGLMAVASVEGLPRPAVSSGGASTG
ncbi:MAG: hypothetical protein EPO21_05905 [Chloroflexota bacterium]|nr:MAG: hypothetical protein EPO21_05905 [Chloroflexota bacterium]